MKVVVITGASAGVGRAVARAYAREGAAVGLLARGERGLQATRLEVETLGGRALAVPTDVSDPEQVEAAAAAVEAAFGPVDVWVNCAVVAVTGFFWDVTPGEYRRVTETLYLGYVNGTRAALRRMRGRDRGVVVQVGSLLAYRGIPLQSPYSGAKHAIQGFTESVRAELLSERSRVRLTMVQLPALNTPHFTWVRTRRPTLPRPVPPVYTPEVAADAVLWAAERGGHEVQVSFTTAVLTLGDKLLPGLGDAVLGLIGVPAQGRREATPEGRPDNLWEPVDEDRGAHGDLGGEARAFSLGWWARKHRRAALAGVAAGALVAVWRAGVRPPLKRR